MREKLIRWPILILLILLNAGLFFFYLSEKRGANSASQQDITRVIELYQREDITFKKQPDGLASPQTSLLIGPADLDKMVTDFLGGRDYDLTYIYGAKVQYNSDSLVIIADWNAHDITYRDDGMQDPSEGVFWGRVLTEEEQLSMETFAKTFAQKWLGEDIIVTGGTRAGEILTITFSQLKDGKIYYFNHAEVTISPGGIASANIECWDVISENKGVDSMPMDEMLYAALDMIKTDKAKSLRQAADEVQSLTDGFAIESVDGDNALAMPCLTLVMESGKQYHLSYVR